MNEIENLQRKENGIIFAPNYGCFRLNISIPCAHNIALWNSNSPLYLSHQTNGGIQIEKNNPDTCKTCFYKQDCAITGDLVHWCKAYAEKPDIYDASHPYRRTAIRILEWIAENTGKPRLFDKDWYRYEDHVTNMIKEIKEG